MKSIELKDTLKSRCNELRDVSIDLLSFLIEGTNANTLSNVRKIQGKIDKIKDSIFNDYSQMLKTLESYEATSRNQAKIEKIKYLELEIEKLKDSLE